MSEDQERCAMLSRRNYVLNAASASGENELSHQMLMVVAGCGPNIGSLSGMSCMITGI